MRKTSFTTLFRLQYSQQLLQFVAGLLLAAGVTTFRLSQLLPGINLLEQQTIGSGLTIAGIRQDPVNLPYKMLVWGMHKLNITNSSDFRYISVFIGLFVLLVFFAVVRHWFGFWISAITTFLLLTSSWFLHICRLATPDVGQLAIIVLIGYGLWIKSHKWPYIALLVGVGLTAISLYIPGLFWVMLIGIIHQRQYLAKALKKTKWLLPVATMIFLALITPLAWQLFLTPRLGLTIFGVPDSITSAYEVIKNIAVIPVRLTWHGPMDPSVWLPGTPLLDYLSSILALLGLYNFLQYRQLDRSKITMAFLLIAIILCGMTNSSLLGYLLPVIYILVASGLAFMVNQWLTVFPKNPFARGLMICLVAIAVSSVSYYQLSHYFLAWARHPETRATFLRK